MELRTTIPITIRFSDVDAMAVVWHGNYVRYFEDAREAFGAMYGLDYMTLYDSGYYVPVVDISFSFRRPLTYGMRPEITIVFRPSSSAKICFDYEIRDTADGGLVAKGHSEQVFLDRQRRLVWYKPPFFERWLEAHLEAADG